MADFTEEQLMQALRAAHQAGDTAGAQRIAGMIQQQRAGEQPQPATPAQAPMTARLSPELAASLGAGEPAQPDISGASQSLSPGVTIPAALLQPTRHGGPRSIDAYAGRGFSEAVANIGDDGVILRNPESGALVFTSPGRNISDQSLVEEMLGDQDLSAVQREDARLTLDQNLGGRTHLLGLSGQYLKGVPFVGSWTDEMFGALQGEEKQRAVNQLNSLYETAYPGRAVTSQVTAGLLNGGALVSGANKMLQGGSLMSRITRGIGLGTAAGATEGAIYGAGQAEPGQRTEGAKQGGLWGAAIGGGIGAAMPVGGVLGRSLYNAWTGRQARRAARELDMDQRVAGFLADRVQADAPYIPQYLNDAGPNAVLGGLGPSTRGLLDAVANSPGQAASIARQNVEEIVEGASDRFGRQLDASLGQPVGPRAVQDGVMRASADARRTAYDAAYQSPIDYASEAGLRLEQLLSRVDGSVIRRAERLMKAEGVPSQQIMASVDDAGNVSFSSMPDVRQIDYITRALRDAGGFSSGLGPDEARVIRGLSSDIRSTLDELVPEYRQARSVAADAISEREAVDLGRSLLRPSVTREDVASHLSGMSPAELTRARQGLRSYVDDVMANVRRGITRSGQDQQEVLRPLRDLTTRASRDKIAALLGDDADDLFRVLDETEQAFSLRANRNSATMPRANEEAAIRELVPEQLSSQIMRDGASSTLMGRLTRMAESGAQTPEQAADEIKEYLARVLTDTGPSVPQRAEALQDFAAMGRRLEQGRSTATSVGQVAGGEVGMGLRVGNRPEYDSRPAILRRLSDLGYSPSQIVNLMSNQTALDAALAGGM